MPQGNKEGLREGQMRKEKEPNKVGFQVKTQTQPDPVESSGGQHF